MGMSCKVRPHYVRSWSELLIAVGVVIKLSFDIVDDGVYPDSTPYLDGVYAMLAPCRYDI